MMPLDKPESKFIWRKADELGVHEIAMLQCLCVQPKSHSIEM